MATGSILLPIGAATPPDTNPAAIVRVKSTGTGNPHFIQALFDAATDESLHWSFRMPADYSSSPVLKIQYKMASATTGLVDFEAYLAAVSDGDATDVDAKAFSTANTQAGVTVPGTAGYLDEVSLTLSNADSLAAGDFVVLKLARDADDATNDTATGDAEVLAVTLQYTTA